jgi:hypothetical protein
MTYTLRKKQNSMHYVGLQSLHSGVQGSDCGIPLESLEPAVLTILYTHNANLMAFYILAEESEA